MHFCDRRNFRAKFRQLRFLMWCYGNTFDHGCASLVFLRSAMVVYPCDIGKTIEKKKFRSSQWWPILVLIRTFPFSRFMFSNNFNFFVLIWVSFVCLFVGVFVCLFVSFFFFFFFFYNFNLPMAWHFSSQTFCVRDCMHHCTALYFGFNLVYYFVCSYSRVSVRRRMRFSINYITLLPWFQTWLII